MINQPMCPYCNKELEKMPTRKRACPHCQSTILVRDGRPVTEKEANHIDEERNAMNWLRTFNALQKDYDLAREQLKNKFGHDPNPNDIIWNIANDQLKKLIQIGDLGALSSQYARMATFLNSQQKETFSILQQARKFELESLKKDGVKKVRIYGHGCTTCLQSKDKVLTIEEAEKNMILPHKNCTCVYNDPNRGFCQCSYYPSYGDDNETIFSFEKKAPSQEAPKTEDVKKTPSCIIPVFTIIILLILFFLLVL